MLRTMVGAALVFALLFTSQVRAEDLRADPSSYVSLLGQLSPGDRLILAPGTYERGLSISGLAGSAAEPIVITGPESGAPAIIAGRSCCNTISIRDSSYVVIRHLEVDGRGLAVDAVKAEGDASFAHHITLENLRMYNFGGGQQIVGINTKCPAWDWVIRGNVIEDAGTGLYLGNSDGNQPFVRGLVEHNLVVNPIGYNMQIKHQNPRPSLAGMPQGDSVTIIRHNVFMKYARASMGGEARPNLLVGHWPPSGPGRDDRYEIYGNFFFQNASGTEGLFQGEGNVAFHDNILVNTLGGGLSIQPQNDVPKDVSIYNNTIYTAGRGVSITGGSSAFTQIAIGNAVFSPNPMNGGMLVDNVTDALGAAPGYVNAVSETLGMIDLYPLPGALEGSELDLDAFSAHADFDRDFNGTPKTRRHRGAYSGNGTNPGWALAEAIKVLDVQPVPADGGVAQDAAPRPDAAPGTDASIDAGTRDATAPHFDAGTADAVEGGCSCAAATDRTGDPRVLLVFALAAVFARLRRV